MAEPPSPLDPQQTVDHVAEPTPRPTAKGSATEVATGLAALSSSETAQFRGYKITGEIAKGGMGRVYAALDLTLDREVAIKTLLPTANANRFVTEARITARLPHPGIPPVHALGTLDDGTPYLAMKRIQGRTLAELLKERSSPADDLPRFVQIFEQIAQAVGFAHHRGIIHRDLKPLNVMVGEFGEVQVMDWGLAKDLTNAQSDEPTSSASAQEHSQTGDGLILGTAGYMSPEQARAELTGPQTDVFALGSLLTIILTGQPAVVGQTAKAMVLKTAAADLSEANARLDKAPADAELIALAKRCLAARAADRPENARLVAEEVAAYRAGVEARLRQAETDRARAETQAAEQVKRRRVVQWSAGTIAVILLLGIAGVSWFLRDAIIARQSESRRANSEAAAKKAALTAAEKEKLAAAKEREATVKELAATALTAERLRQIELINNSVFDIFAEFDIDDIKKSDQPVEAALAKRLVEQGHKLDATAINDPQTLANLQDRLGRTLLSLGHPHEAVEFLTQARDIRLQELGNHHPDTLRTMSNLALSLGASGELERAQALYQEVLDLSIAELGENHPDSLNYLNSLALGYQKLGRLDEALPLLKKSLALHKSRLGPDAPATITAMTNLALCLNAAGKLNEAISINEEAVELSKANLGPEHPHTLLAINNLATSYKKAGQDTKSLALLEDAFRTTRSKLGPDHPETLGVMGNLGNSYLSAGLLDKAIPLLEENAERHKKRLGPDHPDTLISLGRLAYGYKTARQFKLAIPLYEETLAQFQRKLGPDHPNTLMSMNNLAAGYFAIGQTDKALPLMEQTLEIRKTKLGPDHPDTLMSMNNLSSAYLQTKQLDRAIPLLKETVELSTVKLGPTHPQSIITLGNLAKAHVLAEEGDEAVEAFQEYLTRARKFVPRNLNLAGMLDEAGEAPFKVGKHSTAAEFLRESLAIRQTQAPDTWETFYCQSLLGEALFGEEKLKEAEPLLVSGYEGLKAREEKIPAHNRIAIPTALDRLVALYAFLDQPEKAKEYEALRAAYPAAVK